MPGAVAVVSVKPGQKVTRGSPLVSIEAMKMENTVSADRDGVIAKVYVAPGDRVEAKDAGGVPTADVNAPCAGPVAGVKFPSTQELAASVQSPPHIQNTKHPEIHQ
jgi:pyruvate/2-oxoglutarate dehydrogenase complex dihydrolipoamide acyltransferase (E2) component